MFGFLFKMLIIAGVVVGVGWYFTLHGGKIPQIPKITSFSDVKKLVDFKKVDVSSVGGQLSLALDNLVTHPDKNSPVVLGVKITNESIGKLVDVIQGLPPDQVKQIQQIICAPASPSAK